MKGICFFILVLSCIFTACKKDPPQVNEDNINITDPTPTPELLAGVYILNEGNYSWGNGSVSFYNTTNGELESDLFNKVNDRPLGDVVQSMSIFQDKGYIVVNNSGKIEVVNSTSFKSVGTINNLTSPRFFLGINDQKAYVTDLYSNAISVVDLSTNNKTSSIPCPGWTEELVLFNGQVFVTNIQKNYVYVINSVNDIIVDSIPVGLGSNSIVIDKNNKLWVLCGGDVSQQISGSLYRINPANKQVELSLTFPPGANPFKLCLNQTKEIMYFLNQGVFKMSILENALPTTPFIIQGSNLFYGLNLDPKSGIIYLADAVDYVQKGWIFRYNPDNAAKIDSFKVGIIPGNLIFN